MKIIDNNKFIKAVLDKYIKVLIMYITFLSIIIIYLAKKVYITLLVAEKI